MSSECLKRLLRTLFPEAWGSLATSKAAAYRSLQKRMIDQGYPVFLGGVDQDRWVVEEVFGPSYSGYFLELGALDGFVSSNTYVLEKLYGWRGICIEPQPEQFVRLRKNRSCVCVQECIGDAAGEEVSFLLDQGRSGIISEDTDNNPLVRAAELRAAEENGLIVRMRTKTLAQVLIENCAPSTIDFFSFDVEGAETRILRDFPFDDFKFLTLVVERASPELNKILESNGYKFVTLRVGDSFYVHESIPCFDSIPKSPFQQAPAKPAVLTKNFKKKRIPLGLVCRSLLTHPAS